MSMSSALGEIIALGLTPLMVPTPDYIALMNIVWFIPAALGFVLCMYKVNNYNSHSLTNHLKIMLSLSQKLKNINIYH